MAAKGSTASGRRSQAERRNASERKLLDATAEVVAERGSAGATFAAVAEVAGGSRSHPHYLFGSKGAMLEALVAEFSTLYTEEVVGRIGDATGVDAIVTVVRMFVRSLADPLTMTKAFYVLLGESLSAVPELRPALNAYHQWLQDLVRSWIDGGIATGEIRDDIDPASAAALIVATVRGIGFLVLSDPDAYDLLALEQQLVAQIDQSLRG